MEHVENIDQIMGRPVVSLESANELGRVSDLLIDPVSGELVGFSLQKPDETHALISILDVHGIGPDAIVVENEHALVLPEASPLKTIPKAKNDLIGVQVLTEHGQLLGNISHLYLGISNRPVFIYEIRWSLIDKLLGRAFYIPAALGCALSGDATSLVVSCNPKNMHHRLEAAAEQVIAPLKNDFHQTREMRIEVRSHGT